jgi:hypothetical protein
MGGERKVEQWKDGILLNIFRSAKEASDLLQINHPSSVTACCKGKIKNVYGFQFRYKTVDPIEGELWGYHNIGIHVSSKGRFKFPNGYIGTGSEHGSGYLQVHFKRRKYYAHRLVLETFVGPNPSGLECDHIDRNRKNNFLENLRWVTKKVNQGNRNCSKLTIKIDAE